MSKSFKIILAVLALFSIGITIGIILGWNFGFEKLNQIGKNLSTSTKKTETITPVPTPRDDTSLTSGIVELSKDFFLSLNLPVEKKYLDSLLASLIGGRNDSLFLAFFLDKGAEIKSVFKGRVVSIDNFKKGEAPFPNEPDFSQIWIENEDRSLRAGYTLVGDIFVGEGNTIEIGTILGIANEGGLSSRDGANFALSLAKKVAEKEYKVIGLTPDIFLKD